MRRSDGVPRANLGRELSLEAAIAESSRWLGDALAAPGSSPGEHAGRQELELRLADALSRLPADYAEVILLRNVESLPHEEVARRMGAARTPSACSGCVPWHGCAKSSSSRPMQCDDRSVTKGAGFAALGSISAHQRCSVHGQKSPRSSTKSRLWRVAAWYRRLLRQSAIVSRTLWLGPPPVHSPQTATSHDRMTSAPREAPRRELLAVSRSEPGANASR